MTNGGEEEEEEEEEEDDDDDDDDDEVSESVDHRARNFVSHDVSRWHLTREFRVQSKVISWEICGRNRDMWHIL